MVGMFQATHYHTSVRALKSSTKKSGLALHYDSKA